MHEHLSALTCTDFSFECINKQERDTAGKRNCEEGVPPMPSTYPLESERGDGKGER